MGETVSIQGRSGKTTANGQKIGTDPLLGGPGIPPTLKGGPSLIPRCGGSRSEVVSLGDTKMLTETIAVEAIQDAIDNAAKAVSHANRQIGQIRRLESAGIEYIPAHYPCVPYAKKVTRADLPGLRKVVGRVKVISRHPKYDYNQTGLIEVAIAPVSEEFDTLRFEYDTPLKGTRCRVTYTGGYQTIVCDQ